MAIDPLTGINISLRNQVGRELYDYADKYHSFVSVLAALDNMYGTKTRFVKAEDVSGPSAQVEFRATLPVVQGTNAVTGAIAGLELPVQSNFSVVAGKMPWSHYQLREDIRKAYIHHISKDPKSVVPWVKEVATAARDAVYQKISNDLFPTTSVSASSGNAAENRIMALAYPLQNPGTSYEYLELDLNAAGYSDLRATVAGSFGTMTLTNLRRNILLPLRHKNAKVDLAICDSDVYDYIITQAETKVVIENSKTLEYGGEYIRYGGLIWIAEERLDATQASTGSREAHFLDTGVWRFTQKGMTDSFEVIQNPNTSLLLTMLGEFVCQMLCYIPRRNGRATGVTLS